MADMIFNTYAEAASYAKRRAQESGSSIKLERRNEEWVVCDPDFSRQRDVSPDYRHPPSPPQSDFARHDYWEQWRKEREQTEKAIESWEMQKSQHTPCYMCGGKGTGNGRMCKTCMGRGYING